MFGAIGNGIADDTNALKLALQYASYTGKAVLIDNDYLITDSLYLFGAGSLIGTSGRVLINCQSENYIVNPGLIAKNKAASSWFGKIESATFEVIAEGKSAMGGNRIIYPWITDGATIENNTFNVSAFGFSATSSGNDNNFFSGSPVRKNIAIRNNTLNATASSITAANGATPGSEGFALGLFDGVTIENNVVNGCGDDAIAMHFCSNFTIRNNNTNSPRGRIFIANSKDGLIEGNTHQRVAGSGGFIAGQCLLALGFESLAVNNTSTATKNVTVRNNTFIMNDGAVDAAAIMYIRGVRSVMFENNTLTNNSSLFNKPAFYLTDAPFEAGFTWDDPDNLDDGLNLGRVYEVTVDNNVANGTNQRNFIMTGPTSSFIGPVSVKNNTASGYSFYGSTVFLSNNK